MNKSSAQTTTLSPVEAFSEIGKLMSTWVAKLAVRDNLHNAAVLAELKICAKVAAYDRNSTQRARHDSLRNSLRSPRSVSMLKNQVPGLANMLAGSNKMDTGAAFMLIGTHADLSLSEDRLVSDEFVKLVHLARPHWNAQAPQVNDNGDNNGTERNVRKRTSLAA